MADLPRPDPLSRHPGSDRVGEERARAGAGRTPGRRDRLLRLAAGLRRHGRGNGEADLGRAGARSAPRAGSGDAGRIVSCRALGRGRARGHRRDPRPRTAPRSSWGNGALLPRAGRRAVRGAPVRSRDPRAPPGARRPRGRAGAPRRAGRGRSGGGRHHSHGRSRPDQPRPGGVRTDGRPDLDAAAAGGAPARPRADGAAARSDPRHLARPHRRPRRRDAGGGISRRGADPARRRVRARAASRCRRSATASSGLSWMGR